MKSSMLCIYMIAMLLISNVAFGEILNEGPGASSSASASASGSYDYVEDSESGWYYEYTDTTAYCGWTWSISAEAEARACLEYDDWAGATACAQAEVSGIDSGSVYQGASVSGTGEYNGQYLEDDPEEPATDSGGGNKRLNSYEGIAGDSDAVAVAQIEEGTDCWAYAEAAASASVSLSD